MSGIYESYFRLGASSVAWGVILVLLVNFLSLALSVAKYVLGAFGLWCIAERRAIKYSWLAWLPIADRWILGSVADQYQYVALGRIRNRRKVLLVLSIVASVLTVALTGGYASVFVKVFTNLRQLGYMTQKQVWELIVTPVLSTLGVCAVLVILSVILRVLQYVAYYNLFASCNPKHKTLFTVLSIVLPVTLPFFVFACRKKDLGMPPRKDEVAGSIPVENPPEAATETMEE